MRPYLPVCPLVPHTEAPYGSRLIPGPHATVRFLPFPQGGEQRVSIVPKSAARVSVA